MYRAIGGADRRGSGQSADHALLQQGVATSRMVSTVFDGIARHTPEGHAFVADAVEHGFRDAVRHRDEPFGDYGRRVSQA
jgi:enoyl-CoA hydratase